MKPPRLRGAALVAARAAAENAATGAVLRAALEQSLGLDRLAALPASARGETPLDAFPVRAKASERPLPAEELPLPEPSAWPLGVRAYRAAFDAKKTDPVAVVERALARVQALADNRVLNILASHDAKVARREAEAARERLREGKPLGPLDGVPYLLKDELDAEGLPTSIGSRCEPTEPKAADSAVVARLRAAGAIMVAKTVMTEWGMSPLGQNERSIMPHNALHAERVPGGSSTGSAVGVALGVTPFAVGTDGGGSVRIPASLQGLFGIKPTFGRVSREGDGLKGSVGHIGPIAASSVDLALFLDAVASERDPRDPLTLPALAPPKGGFGARLRAGVRGMRIGVPESEWAEADAVVAKHGRAALAELERRGAELVSVSIPLASVAAPVGYLTIGCEALAAQAQHWAERRALMADDLRLSFAVLSRISAADFLDAQRLRASLRLDVARALRTVDVIAMPTTQTTAPPLPVGDRGRAFADTVAIDAMCRFCFLGNLTGLPAGTAPVGLDEDGLPAGLQIVGDAWDEHVVIGVLAELERAGIAQVPRPRAAFDPPF